MKKHSITAISLTVSMLLAAGCSTPTAHVAIPTDTPEISETSNEPSSASPAPDLSRLSTKCVNIITYPSESSPLGGKLVIIELGEDASTYLLDLSSNHKIEIDIGTSHIVTSPDRSRLAAIDLRHYAHEMYGPVYEAHACMEWKKGPLQLRPNKAGEA